MIDLQLNNSGDIIIEDSIFQKPYNVNFCISNTSTQRIRFFSAPKTKDTDTCHQQEIRFYISNERKDCRQGQSIHSSKEQVQAIRLKIETELGDLPFDRKYGSSLWKMQHAIITNKNVQAQILSIIENVVQDIMPYANVNVIFENGNGYFAMGTITVIIQNEDEEVARFSF